MHINFKDPNQNLVFRMRKANKQITHFRFKNFTCRLCVYLSRYSFTRTKEKFAEYAMKYNIDSKYKSMRTLIKKFAPIECC